MTDVIAVQHVHCETLGTIEDALAGSGLSPRHVRVFEGEPVPLEMEGAAGLVVMGGPMGVYEQESYPHLRDEMRLIESALKDERPVLGVCLGSQLLAAALGARVYPGPRKEIGWYEVTLAEAAAGDPVWSRGPRGERRAVHRPALARGPVRAAAGSGAAGIVRANREPGFRARTGSLRHPLPHGAGSAPTVAEWTEVFADELRGAQLDGGKIRAAAGTHLPGLRGIGRSVFSRWAGLVTAGSQTDPPPEIPGPGLRDPLPALQRIGRSVFTRWAGLVTGDSQA